MQLKKILKIPPELAPQDAALLKTFMEQKKKEGKFWKIVNAQTQNEAISLMLYPNNKRKKSLDIADLRTGARVLIGYDENYKPDITHITWEQLIKLIKE